MSVANIMSQYVNVAPQVPPMKIPVRSRSGEGIGYVDIEACKPWKDFLQAVSLAGRYVSVTATVNWGTVGANTFASELIPFGPTLLAPLTPLNVDSGIEWYVITRLPLSEPGLVYDANLVLPYQIMAFLKNYTAAPVTPGDIDMDFLIIPRIG